MDTCVRCGQYLRIGKDILDREMPVEISPGRALCADCYRDLWPEEYRSYFLQQ